MKIVYRYTWMEYEQGWGTSFDGYSYHKDLVEAKKYRKQMIKDQKDAYHLYTEGDPILVEVSQKSYNLVQKNGTWTGELV